MKPHVKCLIYLLNGNKNQEVNGEVKLVKLLINTGYPNLLHGCDLLCFYFVIYFVLLMGLGNLNTKFDLIIIGFL